MEARHNRAAGGGGAGTSAQAAQGQPGSQKKVKPRVQAMSMAVITIDDD